MMYIEGNKIRKRIMLFCISIVAILLVPLAFQAVQEDRRIGVKLGIVNVDDEVGAAVVMGGMADLGNLAPGLKLEGGLEFWHKKCNRSPELDCSYTEIGLDVTVKHYFFLPESTFKPYGGGGLGIHILRKDFSSFGSKPPPSYLHSSSSNDLVLHIVGGTEYPLASNLTGFEELKYSVGGWDYFGLFVGLKVGFHSKEAPQISRSVGSLVAKKEESLPNDLYCSVYDF